MKKNLSISVTASILFLFISLNAFCQWPQWRGPERNGISSEKNLLKSWPAEGPKLLWSVNTVGDGFSSTIVQDQMIFTAGKKDSTEVLTALDLKGNIKWQKVIGRALQSGEWQQSRSTPTYYKNKIYALTALGDIACFDAATGRSEWQMKVFEKFGGNYQSTAESPLITDDKIILTPCGYQTAMVALDRLTGKTLWRSETLRDSNYFGSPVIIKGKSKNYIYQSSKLYDFIVDPADGKIVWRDSRVSEAMVPQVINDKIYLPGEGKKGGTLFRWDEDLKKRNVIWTDTVKALIISGSAVINDKLFVSTLPRGIACIDMKTGQQISRYNRIRTCNFLAADNMLYCYEDGTARLYMFKVTPNGFELVSSFKTASGTGPAIAHLALANGVLYVRHGTSLMAYDLREPKG